jgi:hypothetical protein
LILLLRCLVAARAGCSSWSFKKSACALRPKRFFLPKNKISDSNQKVAMVLACLGLE